MRARKKIIKPCREGHDHWFGVSCDYDGGIEEATRPDTYCWHQFDFCPWCGQAVKSLWEEEEE